MLTLGRPVAIVRLDTPFCDAAVPAAIRRPSVSTPSLQVNGSALKLPPLSVLHCLRLHQVWHEVSDNCHVAYGYCDSLLFDSFASCPAAWPSPHLICGKLRLSNSSRPSPQPFAQPCVPAGSAYLLLLLLLRGGTPAFAASTALSNRWMGPATLPRRAPPRAHAVSRASSAGAAGGARAPHALDLSPVMARAQALDRIRPAEPPRGVSRRPSGCTVLAAHPHPA